MVITKAARGRPSPVSIYQAVDDGISELRRIGGSQLLKSRGRHLA